MAAQPLGQCTAKIATSMVAIKGIEIQRVARPINNRNAPTNSV